MHLMKCLCHSMEMFMLDNVLVFLGKSLANIVR